MQPEPTAQAWPAGVTATPFSSPSTGARSRRQARPFHRAIKLARRFSTGSGRVGRWLWTGRSWSYHAEHPAPGTEGGVFAPDPLSGGMLYYSYSPPAPSYGGPIPRDRTGTRCSQTWLWHDGRFTRESSSRAPAWDQALMASDARIGRTVVIGAADRLWGMDRHDLATAHLRPRPARRRRRLRPRARRPRCLRRHNQRWNAHQTDVAMDWNAMDHRPLATAPGQLELCGISDEQTASQYPLSHRAPAPIPGAGDHSEQSPCADDPRHATGRIADYEQLVTISVARMGARR